jgi:D-amino peptidase
VKIFLSADIEGTAGIAAWDEAERSHRDYSEFRALMTEEVAAACEGARAPPRRSQKFAAVRRRLFG